ncbi:MAG TPA: serine dehydratase subunit alpha family protein [Elusimicrobia bacterium]|nr:serine dehydratase subunit alpha family protein [Elusimicrobiota bacterium]HBT62707.1 serine dehydratase subunit alpha family protein [Elusimicrobiota bacterium]
MNILKEVLKRQVYPAMGCTEPVTVALAASHAAKLLGEPAREALFILDPGTYKNGMGVTLPNTNGQKGNLLAAAIGLLAARPDLKMEIFRSANSVLVAKAGRLVKSGSVQMTVLPGHQGIHVEARLKGRKHSAVCVISESHTSLTYAEKDGRKLLGSARKSARQTTQYKNLLRRATIKDMLRMAERMDEKDQAYIRKGVEMNLAAARQGMSLRKVGFYLQDLLRKGYLQDDVFSSAKILTACATDLRMDGRAVPVMSSGESGNQGIVAILVPYSVGKAFRVDDGAICRSIAFSHLLNAYVKIFTGGLAPVCGCAIAAGVGAAAAIVYQRNGRDIPGITLAVNNVISDLGGMLCDGAKSGCALKVVSSTDSAIRSAYMGIHHYGITSREGFVGRCAEETIQNLGRISAVGMAQVDPTIVEIMLGKQAGSRL